MVDALDYGLVPLPLDTREQGAAAEPTTLVQIVDTTCFHINSPVVRELTPRITPRTHAFFSFPS